MPFILYLHIFNLVRQGFWEDFQLLKTDGAAVFIFISDRNLQVLSQEPL